MKIQIGDVFMDKENGRVTHPNKTNRYLIPCLLEYGKLFKVRYSNVFKVAVGIGDVVVDNRGLKYERHLFILLDSLIATKNFLSFIEWIREQPMYADDYVYDNITKSNFHMVVLKIPEKFYPSLDAFKEGKYSQMYNEEAIKNFFEKFPDTQKILIKDHNYKIVFIGRLNKLFGTTLAGDDIKEYDGELDLPPNPEKELFNHHLKT